MAKRPIFIPNIEGNTFVTTIYVEFIWFPGMAFTQKQKSVSSLHESACNLPDIKKVLEISSKSNEQLGVNLSAFNLSFYTKNNRKLTVECAYQGSKVFERGGPFTDIFDMTSIHAKKDERIKTSGHLKSFKFYGVSWGLEPQTAFYDWLYINALRKQSDEIIEDILSYSAFSDIEFNPKKSLNCQAYSTALYISLYKRNLLDIATKSKEDFITTMGIKLIDNAHQNDTKQPTLF